MTSDPVVVVGAGLAGLATAVELERLGREVVVIDASDGPGGRVRTDLVDGYRLDRGFQILLTAYPMVGRLLDLDALAPRAFLPGALVRLPDGATATVGDPLRRPGDLLATARAPIGSIGDKARILAFRRAVGRGSLDELWARPDTTARERLEAAGFSARMIERFFRPLFAGITLDDDLAGSSRVLEFVFRMLAAGDAAVPAAGMGAISEQLADRVHGPIHYDAAAQAVAADGVTLASGDRLSASAVVVATDASSAASLVGLADHGWRGVTTLWLAADRAPVDEARIVLNGTGAGPITNLAVMSAVSDAYAPAGRHLVAVSGSGTGGGVPDSLRTQLGDWCPEASSWTLLRVDEIERAQPVQLLGSAGPSAAQVDDGLFVAGDHRHDPSINGALASGVAAARAVAGARARPSAG